MSHRALVVVTPGWWRVSFSDGGVSCASELRPDRDSIDGPNVVHITGKEGWKFLIHGSSMADLSLEAIVPLGGAR